MTKPILCFGEALIDLLQDHEQLCDGLTLPVFTQYPGGAPANVAVALAKLGCEVRILGQVGSDTFGDFMRDSLNHYGVNTDWLFRHATAATAVAFVNLDATGDRHFTFHRNQTADLLMTSEQIPSLACFAGGWLHLCSNTLTEPTIRAVHMALVANASAHGIGVSFDVNLRANLWPNEKKFIAPIKAMLSQADVIKVSRDELIKIFPNNSEEALSDFVFAAKAKAILITDGAHPVVVKTPERRFEVVSPKVEVVDTTAAGDAFSGGLLSVLGQQNFSGSIDVALLEQAAKRAVECGSYAVQRAGAFPSLMSLPSGVKSK